MLHARMNPICLQEIGLRTRSTLGDSVSYRFLKSLDMTTLWHTGYYMHQLLSSKKLCILPTVYLRVSCDSK
jgi:hypothetical protein